jgi:hypothetical protein
MRNNVEQWSEIRCKEVEVVKVCSAADIVPLKTVFKSDFLCMYLQSCVLYPQFDAVERGNAVGERT